MAAGTFAFMASERFRQSRWQPGRFVTQGLQEVPWLSRRLVLGYVTGGSLALRFEGARVLKPACGLRWRGRMPRREEATVGRPLGTAVHSTKAHAMGVDFQMKLNVDPSRTAPVT